MTDAGVTCPAGHGNAVGQKFCGECGAKLSAITQQLPAPSVEQVGVHIPEGGLSSDRSIAEGATDDRGRSPLMKTSRSRKKIAIGLGIIGILLAAALAKCVAGTGFSPAEKSYLDALTNPCGHPEIFDDPQSAGCAFGWGSDSKVLVAEGKQICALENYRPPGDDYNKVHDYLATRHPSYSRTQINTQLIAAEKLLCGVASPKPKADRPAPESQTEAAQDPVPPVPAPAQEGNGASKGTGNPDQESESYQYGYTKMLSEARMVFNAMIWRGEVIAGASPSPQAEACRRAFDAELQRKSGTAAVLTRLDRDEVLRGCADALTLEMPSR